MKRSPHPVVVLAIVLAIPAVVLAVIWQVSDGIAAAARPGPETLQRIEAELAPKPAPVGTPLGDWRRSAAAIAADLSREEFEQQVAQFGATLNDRSCLSISVGGSFTPGRNEQEPVIPASLQKLLIAAVALETLGADFRYRTTVVGSVENGVVNGNLWFVGGGDPLLAADWYPSSGFESQPVVHHTSLDLLADSIVAAGVRRVEGSVVGVDDRYDDERFAPGWGAGVGGVYGGPYGALMVNDSLVRNSSVRQSDPAQAAAAELARLLGDRGVEISAGAGSSRSGPESGVVEIASVESVPMALVVEELLTTSDNNTGELLLKEIGFQTSGSGTREAGLASVATRLDTWGIDRRGLDLVDGSGLSQLNRLTCRAVVEVLQRFRTDPVFVAALPIAGQEGTMANQFVGSDLDGVLLGKTGSLGNPPAESDPPAVKALAGYLPVGGGLTMEYAMVLMGPTINNVAEYRPVWDQFGRLVSGYRADLGIERLLPR